MHGAWHITTIDLIYYTQQNIVDLSPKPLNQIIVSFLVTCWYHRGRSVYMLNLELNSNSLAISDGNVAGQFWLDNTRRALLKNCEYMPASCSMCWFLLLALGNIIFYLVVCVSVRPDLCDANNISEKYWLRPLDHIPMFMNRNRKSNKSPCKYTRTIRIHEQYSDVI